PGPKRLRTCARHLHSQCEALAHYSTAGRERSHSWFLLSRREAGQTAETTSPGIWPRYEHTLVRPDQIGDTIPVVDQLILVARGRIPTLVRRVRMCVKLAHNDTSGQFRWLAEVDRSTPSRRCAHYCNHTGG